MISETARVARAVLAERRGVAEYLRRAKIEDPVGEVEEHVNDVLDGLVRDVLEGRHHG